MAASRPRVHGGIRRRDGDADQGTSGPGVSTPTDP